MGCGKTFLGKQIAQKLQYNFIDVDEEIEKEYNSTITEIFEKKGESYFREIEYKKLVQIINTAKPNSIIATGGGTPCNKNAIELMNNKGNTIWLNQSINVIAKNIQAETNKRPLLQHSNFTQICEKLNIILQNRLQYYSKSTYQLQATEISVKQLLNIINND